MTALGGSPLPSQSVCCRSRLYRCRQLPVFALVLVQLRIRLSAGQEPTPYPTEAPSEAPIYHFWEAESISFCPDPLLYHLTPEKTEYALVCTTTTTTTTTTTEFRNSTTTTTTTPQARECREYCYKNAHPWFMKCEWATCVACQECANVVGFAPVTTKPAPVTFVYTTMTAPQTTTSTTSTSSTTTTTTTTRDPDAPTAAPTYPPLPPETVENAAPTRRRRSTSTTQINFHCLTSCYRPSNLQWEAKCEWTLCYECDECRPPTPEPTFSTTFTTTTTTIITTTTITNSTTSTTTTTTTTTTQMCRPPTSLFPLSIDPCAEPLPEGWNDNYDNNSSNGTNGSNGSNNTSNLSKNSTPTPTESPTLAPTFAPTIPCASGVRMCGLGIPGNESCTAQTVKHPCVEQMEITFSCPAYNNDSNLESSYVKSKGKQNVPPKVYCTVCNLDDNENDTDSGRGSIKLKLRFGPNMLGSEVNEDGITGYGVYMVDECLQMLGQVGYIDTNPNLSKFGNCCTENAYEVDIHAEMPLGNATDDSTLATEMAFMVVPQTIDGNLSVGAVTKKVEDWIRPKAAPTGDACRCGIGVIASVALFAALVRATLE